LATISAGTGVLPSDAGQTVGPYAEGTSRWQGRTPTAGRAGDNPDSNDNASAETVIIFIPSALSVTWHGGRAGRMRALSLGDAPQKSQGKTGKFPRLIKFAGTGAELCG
jgi:hypothetical protein